MTFVLVSTVVLVLVWSVGRRLVAMTRGDARTNHLRTAGFPVAVVPAVVLILLALAGFAFRTLLGLLD